jgi:hypothetical protein
MSNAILRGFIVPRYQLAECVQFMILRAPETVEVYPEVPARVCYNLQGDNVGDSVSPAYRSLSILTLSYIQFAQFQTLQSINLSMEGMPNIAKVLSGQAGGNSTKLSYVLAGECACMHTTSDRRTSSAKDRDGRTAPLHCVLHAVAPPANQTEQKHASTVANKCRETNSAEAVTNVAHNRVSYAENHAVAASRLPTMQQQGHPAEDELYQWFSQLHMINSVCLDDPMPAAMVDSAGNQQGEPPVSDILHEVGAWARF